MATAERVYPGETTSGDLVSWRPSDEGCQLAVIDGAGHGPAAAAAAAKARAALEGAALSDLAGSLGRCHAALKATRGAVASVAWIEPARDRLLLAGVGNVEAYVWSGGRGQHPATQRGLLGVTMPRVRPFEVALDEDWALVLHSDGMRSRFGLEDLELQAAMSAGPLTLAERLLEAYARRDDDVLVAVAVAEPALR